MNSKNKKPQTANERAWVDILKHLPCAVCGEIGPSDCHEIKQGQWFTSIALCRSCHTGPMLGLHGQKRAWIVRKMNELDALNITLERMFKMMPVAHPDL